MLTTNWFISRAKVIVRCRCRCQSLPRRSLTPIHTWRTFSSGRNHWSKPLDSSDFNSVVDNPPTLVRTGRKHGPGLIILALIPITAFCLGTWQISRLEWKTSLIAKLEDRLLRPPLQLPPHVDPDAVTEFDYRRVLAKGRLRHDQEMLIGPRIHDGHDGYLVITPLEREPHGSTILVNRGWISKRFRNQIDRRTSLPDGTVTVEGLLRSKWKKNIFTPENRPDIWEFYFPDVDEMAKLTGSQPVWVEETMKSDLVAAYEREAKGVPIGRPAEVNLRNNHTQYIFTWYALSLATSVMFCMVIRKTPSEAARRVRQNKEW